MNGERRDMPAMLMRVGLTPLSWIYSLAVRIRNRGFERRPERITQVERPVISIGNITTGGTGKTPMVEWIARQLRKRNLRVAVISRGYGAEDGGQNDEAMELEQRLPDVPHLQNPDRVAAARVAIDELDSQLLLLDDAFQHRRIARDLNLVLIDALTPFGYGHLLPRGLLREPLAGLKRADMIVLTRADQVDETRRREIRSVVARYAPDAEWAECAHRPTALINHSGQRFDVASLHDWKFGAFCGIGNPSGFLSTLAAQANAPPPHRTFPDHHAYQRSDIEQLETWAADNQLSHLVCTHKDLVKIGLDRLGATKLLALMIEVDFTSGEDWLVSRIEQFSEQVGESP